MSAINDKKQFVLHGSSSEINELFEIRLKFHIDAENWNLQIISKTTDSTQTKYKGILESTKPVLTSEGVRFQSTQDMNTKMSQMNNTKKMF